MTDALLTVRELAALTKFTPETIRRWTANGRIPETCYVKYGDCGASRVRYLPTVLIALGIEGPTRPAPPDRALQRRIEAACRAASKYGGIR